MSLTKQISSFLKEAKAEYQTEVTHVEVYGLPNESFTESEKALVEWDFSFDGRSWGIKDIMAIVRTIRISWMRITVGNETDAEIEVPQTFVIDAANPGEWTIDTVLTPIHSMSFAFRPTMIEVDLRSHVIEVTF